MRAILINQYAGSPHLGMEFRPHWMATQWQARGHDVVIVCGDRSHLRRDPNIGVGMADREGVNFLSLPTSAYHGNGPARFANLLSFGGALRMTQRRLERFQPDIVIASSTHPFDVRPAYRLARATGATFVFEVHDLWPLTPMLLGGVSARHPAMQMMMRAEGFAYRHADLVVSLLPNTREYMESRGLPADRWIWIPNGISSHALDDPKMSPALATLREGVTQIRERYRDVLIYAGGHGPANALEDMLDRAGTASDLGIAMVLLGSGPLKPELQQRFADTPNVFFFDPVPRDEVVGALRLADFAYAGAMPSPLYRYGIAFNKLYDYMAAGLPVIENIGAANSPVAEAGCGLVADPADPGSLDDALRRIASASSAQRRMWGDSGRRVVEHHLRQELLADRMMQAMAGATRRL